MRAGKFFNQLKDKIEKLSEEERIDIFNQDGLKILKTISESCDNDKYFTIIYHTVESKNIKKIIKKFNLSAYYKRPYTIIFLTNFDGKRFSRYEDDRYRFLKCIFPNSEEYKQINTKRRKFFKDQMK